jgi:hypothetical protein
MPKIKPIEFQFFSDPGHGWLQVPVTFLRSIGQLESVTPYSYVSPCQRFAYLEEDCDLSNFLRRCEELGFAVHVIESDSHREREGESAVRGFASIRSIQ